MGNIDPYSHDLTPELIRLAEEIGATLRGKYRGKANAVTANRIADGYAKRGIRVSRHELCPMVNWLRTNGARIGSCKHGYYWIETDEELAETVENLRAREAGIARAREGMTQ